MDIKCNGAVHLIIILKGAHIIVFRQGAFQLLVQGVVGHISDAEHIYAKFMQAITKMRTGDGVCR